MSVNAVWEAVKALATSLQVSMLIPSTLFVLVNFYFILPRYGINIEDSSLPQVIFLSTFILGVSYGLYAFNGGLIRLVEGYPFRRLGFGRALESYYRQKVSQLKDAKVQAYANWLNEKDAESKAMYATQVAEIESTLDVDFPTDTSMILPTPLGNVLAAFEDYSRTRYGMESIVLWPRFVPLLRDKKYLDFVAQEKAVFDFLLNMAFFVFVVGIELWFTSLWEGEIGIALVVVGVSLILLWVLFHALVATAKDWGTMFRVAFDLYRHELHDRLYLKEMDGFADEFEQWKRVSMFLVFPSQRTIEMRSAPKFRDFVRQTKAQTASKKKTQPRSKAQSPKA